MICGFNDIMLHTKKVHSTISWHNGKIKAANIIKTRKQNEYNYYEIVMDRQILLELLSKYKTNFTEKIVVNYICRYD